jgi:UDPglucose 6-dehydrogenase
MEEAAKIMPDVVMTDGAYEAAAEADAVAIVTEWDAFRALDLKKLKAAMKGDALLDLRNIYSAAEAEKESFRYFSIGR